MSGVILKWLAEANSLTAKEVLFESYLACVWLSAEIGTSTYMEFLDYVADLNKHYIQEFIENVEKLKAENHSS